MIKKAPPVIKRSAFLPIASPRFVKEPPTGPDSLHEVKFDGFRLQAHKLGAEVRLFSKAGKDLTNRFPAIAAAVARIPATAAAVDGELVACDATDRPDFYSLLRRAKDGLCVWAFDLLHLNGEDLRGRPLIVRKRLLSDLLAGDVIRYAAHFDDGEKLLQAAADMRLEGIVSKRRMAAYKAGSRCGWLKVKTAEWRAANRERHKLFEK